MISARHREDTKAQSRTNQFLRVFAPSWFIVLVAFAIRLWALGAQSLWFDEGWSWHLARMPLAEMALTTAGDRSPPLYYALLHAWIRLAGQSEFAMRFISALADTATVALVMAFAGALWRGGRNVAPAVSLIAGAIYAVCPFAVWYAQETRMYALVATLCTASSYALWRWLRDADGDRPDRSEPSGRRPAVRSLVASATLLGLAIYSHYYAIFLLPAHFLVVLIASWKGKHFQFSILNFQFLIAAVCVVTSLIPWLLVASTGFAYDDGFSFPLNTIDGRLLEWVRSLASGGLAHPLPAAWPWLVAGASALGVAGFAINRRWRELALMLALIIGPLLAATIAVRLVYPYRSVFHPRYLIYVVPTVCMLFGAAGALTVAHRSSLVARASLILRVSSCLLIGALWLPLLGAYFTDPALWRDDTRGAVQHVVEAIEPGDVVVMSRDNFAVTYYWPSEQASLLVALPPGLHGVLQSDEAVIGALNNRQPERVRLMLWQDDVVDPQRFIESTLWPNGYEIGEFNFARIRLPLYRVERRPIARASFQEANITFGEPGRDRLVLRRYWQPKRATAGDWFYAILEWEAQQPMSMDYKVFVHVVGVDGRPAFQNDKLPLNALLPMTRWQPGEVLRDAHAMVAPADLPAGVYRVVTGVYDPATGRRLPAYSGDRELGTAVSLGTVAVQSP
ncbi:MAG: glycosyltransferase family 39 protein [Anaerolineae bacterium]|nr:glycosyltransferase family 39 protein [Anaerolineae bacterium]